LLQAVRRDRSGGRRLALLCVLPLGALQRAQLAPFGAAEPATIAIAAGASFGRFAAAAKRRWMRGSARATWIAHSADAADTACGPTPARHWMAGAERAPREGIRGGRAGAAIRGATCGAAGRSDGWSRAGHRRQPGDGGGRGRGGGAARAAGAGAGRAGAAAGAAFLPGGSANASPMVATIIEMARTLAAQPTPDRIIVLPPHAATKCNARTVDWFRGTSIVAPFCGEFACGHSPGVHR
jgi:hypothetical protein